MIYKVTTEVVVTAEDEVNATSPEAAESAHQAEIRDHLSGYGYELDEATLNSVALPIEATEEDNESSN